MPRLTIEQQNYIKENFLNYPGSYFAKKLNINRSSYYKILQKNNLIVPKELQMQWKVKSSLKSFTAEEKQYLIDNVSNFRLSDLAKIMKRSTVNISKQCYALGLKDILQEKYKKTQFTKGHISHNKGKKMEEFLTPEQIEKIKQSQFKPGNIPHNTLPEGTEALRNDKNGKTYTFLKHQGKLELKSRVIYKQHYGKIPKDHIIIFKDGNTFNFNIENLECISLQENLERNTLHRYPKEIRKIIHLKGVLNRQINKNNPKNQ